VVGEKKITNKSAASDTAATAYRTVSITAKWIEPK